MPIQHIEQKIECGRGLLGKRDREDIGCSFPKHSCGKRGWAYADAVWSDTKAGTRLLPPLQRDALVYNGQGSVRYGKRDSQHVIFKVGRTLPFCPLEKLALSNNNTGNDQR